LETWPQQPLSAATITFFDNNGHLFIQVNDVSIDRNQTTGYPLISSAFDTVGNTLFGTMYYFDTSPTIKASTTLCRHFGDTINAGQVYLFPRPPRVMKTIYFSRILPRSALNESTLLISSKKAQHMTTLPLATSAPSTTPSYLL
jgi:hypothetical protein